MGWEANSCKASAPLVATRTLNPASSNNILRHSRPFNSSSTHRIRGLLGMALLRFFAGQAHEELALAWFSGAAPPCSEHDLYQTRNAQQGRTLGLKGTWECKHYLVHSKKSIQSPGSINKAPRIAALRVPSSPNNCCRRVRFSRTCCPAMRLIRDSIRRDRGKGRA